MFDNPLQTVLPASDLERAISWYREAFGWEPYEVDPQLGARYRQGGVEFGLYPSQFAGTNKATAATLKVEDFDAAVAHLRSKGVTFEEVDFGPGGKTVDGVLSHPEYGTAAWIRDSEGNILGIGTR